MKEHLPEIETWFGKLKSFPIQVNGKLLSGDQLARKTLRLIGHATEEIAIASYVMSDFYIPSEEQKMMDFLTHKLREQVNIYILLGEPPNKYMRDHLSQLQSHPNAMVRICPRVHMKVILSDRREGIISTGNISSAGTAIAEGRKRNFEVAVSFKGAPTIQLLKLIIEIAHGDYCSSEKCMKFAEGSCPGVQPV